MGICGPCLAASCLPAKADDGQGGKEVTLLQEREQY